MSESVWSYPRPPRVEASRRRVRMACDGLTLVAAQPGDICGGRVTRDISGPPKGGPGTGEW